jgi:hypothetical protein
MDSVLFELPLARRRPADLVQAVTAMNAACQPCWWQKNVAEIDQRDRQIGVRSLPTVRTSRLARMGVVHTYISSGRTPRMPDRTRQCECYRRYSPSQKGKLCECERSGKGVGRGHRTKDKRRRRPVCLCCVASAGLLRIPVPSVPIDQSSWAPSLTPPSHQNAHATPPSQTLPTSTKEPIEILC